MPWCGSPDLHHPNRQSKWTECNAFLEDFRPRTGICNSLVVGMAFGLIHDPLRPGTYVQSLTALVCIWITWPFVLLRCYVRMVMVKKMGADDWLMVITQVSGFQKLDLGK
jgi:hypothetical protein